MTEVKICGEILENQHRVDKAKGILEHDFKLVDLTR